MSKKCPTCQTENRDQAKRCMNCNYVFMAETPVRMCPAGRHVMDPGWSTCPYCSGGQDETAPPQGGGRAATVPEGSPFMRQPTMPENSPLPKPKPPPPPPAPERAAGSSRRKTAFGDSTERPDQLPTARHLRQPAATRRMAAILVTYTWRPDGEVLPLREGRNYIGSDPDCEVCLRDDPQMSSRHATIIYRGKGTSFIIDDEKSMNGTFVNDASIDAKTALTNYAKIKTGATVWTFIMFDPPSTE
ncbi:MAG: hypothetical protein V7641_573 [Blastocatellia bacterium]